MNEQSFLELMAQVEEQCSWYGYRRFTCNIFERIFGLAGEATFDYKEFVKPFLGANEYILEDDLEMSVYIRMALVQAFKEEVLSTKRYLEY